MASDIKTIRDKIADILGGISNIQAVYKYPRLEVADSGYPYAWVVWKNQESEVLTNREDIITYEFEINLIQEKIEEFKGREAAEETTMSRAYDICEAFRAKNRLDLDDVIRTMPISIEKLYLDNGTRLGLKVVLAITTKEEST